VLELFSWHFYFKTQTLKISLAVLHFLLIFYAVYLLGKKWDTVSSKLFWSAFLFRLAAGISLGLIYKYYYSANDTWLFFENAQNFSLLAKNDFISFIKALLYFGDHQRMPGLADHDLRSIFFIKIISLFCLLSNSNYWVCASYFSLLAFTCSWGLHRKICNIFPESNMASAFAFLFFPSVTFWSSGLEKESLALCGIYFLAMVFLMLMTGEKIKIYFGIFIILAFLMIWSLKYYWAVVFVISTFTALSIKFLTVKFPESKNDVLTIWFLLFFGISIALSFSHPNFYLSRLVEVIVSNHREFAAISDQRNLIHYFQFEPTVKSLIINSPWAFFSALFRPLVGEGKGLLGWAASIENFFLLLLFVSSLANLKSKFKISDRIILLTASSYCIVLSTFLALSTPNFGTLSRYRAGFLAFFVFIVVYRNPLLDWISKKIRLKDV